LLNKRKNKMMLDTKVLTKEIRKLILLAKADKRRTSIVLIILIIGAALFIRSAIERSKEEAPKKELEQVARVSVFKVTKTKFEDTIPVMGLVSGKISSDLVFEVNGIVDKVSHREGDVVLKGGLIISLDKKDARLKYDYSLSKLRTAEAEMRAQEQEFIMKKELFDACTITKNAFEKAGFEFDAVKSKYDSAFKEMEFARSELEKTELKAPFPGILGSIEVQEGEFVTPNRKVTSIHFIKSVYVDSGIIEKDLDKVTKGFEVKLTVDTFPGKTYTGKIVSISPVVEGRTRSANAKIEIENNDSKALLLPGMFARAEIVIFKKDDAMIVPRLSLKDLNKDGESESVYVVNDEKARAVEVKQGYVSTDYVEIIEGLKEGDRVIVESEGSLENLPKVEIIEQEEAIDDEPIK